MWACATLGVKAPKLFKALDQQSDRLLRDFIPQDVANLVWACATLGVKAPKLFEALDQQSDQLLRDGTLQNITNSVWPCATLGMKAPSYSKRWINKVTGCNDLLALPRVFSILR